MVEIMAIVGTNGNVELVNDRSAKIESIEPMTPLSAAYLARSLLACAAALSTPSPPKVGTIGGDAHLPIMTWGVGLSNITGDQFLMLSIPSGIELTFVMPPKCAKELGSALVAQEDGSVPLEGQSGTVH